MEMKKEQVIGVATVVATSILMFAGNVSADGVTIGSSEPGTSVEAPDKGGDTGVVIGKETTKPAPAEPSTKDGVIGENKKPDTQPSDVEKPKDEGKSTEPSQPANPEKDKELPKPAEDKKVEEKPTQPVNPISPVNPDVPVNPEKPVAPNVTEADLNVKPIIDHKGNTVVGTKDGNVLVKKADGSVVEKKAAEIGAVRQKDGTVALKDEKGELKILPSTGEEQKMVVSLLGASFALFAGALKFKNFKFGK